MRNYTILKNQKRTAKPCAICGGLTKLHRRPEIFFLITHLPVCRKCGEKYLPKLQLEVELARDLIFYRDFCHEITDEDGVYAVSTVTGIYVLGDDGKPCRKLQNESSRDIEEQIEAALEKTWQEDA